MQSVTITERVTMIREHVGRLKRGVRGYRGEKKELRAELMDIDYELRKVIDQLG